MHNRNRVIRVQWRGPQTDDDRPPLQERMLLLGRQVVVVREDEGRVRRKASTPDILAALADVHERGTEPVQRFLERRLRCEDAGRDLAFHARRVRKGGADERRITADVRLVGPEAEALESYEPRRVWRSEEEEPRLDIAADVVSDQESRVRRVQQDVKPARPARKVVQRERGIRSGPMTHD